MNEIEVNSPEPTAAAPEVEAPAASVTEQKTALRTAFRTARKSLTPEARKKANKAILNKVHHSQALARAKTILIYAATANEPVLDDLISAFTRAGKRVAVPRMTKTPGVMTLWAVRHVDALVEVSGSPIRNIDVTRASPIEPKDVDCVLVPGVAFTRTMGRLGQGGGYYDRLFARLPAHTLRIGIGYDIQLADELPIEEHDMPMHAVVTETGVHGDVELLLPVPAPTTPPAFATKTPDPAEPEKINADEVSP